MEETKKWLKAVGIEPERLRVERTSVDDKRGLSGIIMNFASDLREIGVNPLQKHLG